MAGSGFSDPRTCGALTFAGHYSTSRQNSTGQPGPVSAGTARGVW